MKREELKTATNDELIDELNYCGYDSYYRDYRDDVVAEIKKRMQEPVLDKIRAEIDELDVLKFSSGERIYKDEVLDIIDKYMAESEDKE